MWEEEAFLRDFMVKSSQSMGRENSCTCDTSSIGSVARVLWDSRAKGKSSFKGSYPRGDLSNA